MKIRIEWLSDSNECDQCGGGYADGAKVYFDEELTIDNVPVAACYGSEDNWSETDIYKEIFKKLGHELENEY